LYFLGLSFRNMVKALSFLIVVNKIYVSIWTWFKNTNHRNSLNRKIKEYIIDETVIKVGSELIYLLADCITKVWRNPCCWYIKGMKYVCCRAISVSSSKQVWITLCFIHWWYMISQNCRFLKLSHYIHYSWKKHYWKNNAIYKG